MTGNAARSRGGAALFVRDFGPLVAVILVYFLLRGQIPVNVDRAVDLAVWLIDVEKRLHIFVEVDLQEATTGAGWSRELASFTYAYLHFPALAGLGVWLWWSNRRAFVLVRNTMYVSMVIGLVVYLLLPAAPPRLMAAHGRDYGFVDTVFGGGTAVPYPQPSFYVNDYAAVPSYHFGWMALVSVAIWSETRSKAGRALAVILLLSMVWASAATANHLFIDMFFGGVAVFASWLIARRLTARAPRRGSGGPEPSGQGPNSGPLDRPPAAVRGHSLQHGPAEEGERRG